MPDVGIDISLFQTTLSVSCTYIVHYPICEHWARCKQTARCAHTHTHAIWWTLAVTSNVSMQRGGPIGIGFRWNANQTECQPTHSPSSLLPHINSEWTFFKLNHSIAVIICKSRGACSCSMRIFIIFFFFKLKREINLFREHFPYNIFKKKYMKFFPWVLVLNRIHHSRIHEKKALNVNFV